MTRVESWHPFLDAGCVPLLLLVDNVMNRGFGVEAW